MPYTTQSKSGLQNIVMTKENSHAVYVSGNYLGTFKIKDRAIKVRDDYRLENNMPPAKDRLNKVEA